MADPGFIKIKSWTVSFYDNGTRRWKYGVLKVTPAFSEFTEHGNDNHEPYAKIIYHCDVTDVKKSMTGLIYRALVLTLYDKSKYWISSLPDQTEVYNVLHYFQYQNLLYSKKQNIKHLESVESTEMGRKLLKSVIDSENTLTNAANVLREQGTQIVASYATMHDIHNDLDVADNVLTGLESWLGKWKIPKQYKKESLEVVQATDLPEELDYEVLYTKLEMGKNCCQCLGILRVCVEGVFVLTDKQKVVHKFKWTDISVVKILSLCQVMITQYMIGRPDLTYDIVCTNLLPVLRLLDRKLKTKVEYMADVFDEQRPKTKPTTGTLGKLKAHLFSTVGVESSFNTCTDPSRESVNEADDNETMSSQVQGQKQIVTDQEVEEICQTLQNIKSVAMATGQELDAQNENIDKLTTSVDRANQRLNSNEKRINHLT